MIPAIWVIESSVALEAPDSITCLTELFDPSDSHKSFLILALTSVQISLTLFFTSFSVARPLLRALFNSSTFFLPPSRCSSNEAGIERSEAEADWPEMVPYLSPKFFSLSINLATSSLSWFLNASRIDSLICFLVNV